MGDFRELLGPLPMIRLRMQYDSSEPSRSQIPFAYGFWVLVIEHPPRKKHSLAAEMSDPIWILKQLWD